MSPLSRFCNEINELSNVASTSQRSEKMTWFAFQQNISYTVTHIKINEIPVVGRNYWLHANQHRARVQCVRLHRKPLTLDGLFETP